MTTRFLLLLTPLLLLASGCTVNMAKFAKALGNDPAFISLKVTSIYGTGVLVRDGRPGAANTVTPDGAVTSTPTNVVPPPPTIHGRQLPTP